MRHNRSHSASESFFFFFSDLSSRQEIWQVPDYNSFEYDPNECVISITLKLSALEKFIETLRLAVTVKRYPMVVRLSRPQRNSMIIVQQATQLTRRDRGEGVLLRRGAGIAAAGCDGGARRRVRCRRCIHGGRAGEGRQRRWRRWWRRGRRRGWKWCLRGARRQGAREVAGVASRAAVPPRIARRQAKLWHV